MWEMHHTWEKNRGGKELCGEELDTILLYVHMTRMHVFKFKRHLVPVLFIYASIIGENIYVHDDS